MVFVNHLARVTPEHELTQERVLQMGRDILRGKVPFLEQALGLYRNAGVETRFLARDLDEIFANEDLEWRNGVFEKVSIELGTKLVDDLLARSGWDPGDIDAIITTSCTGFMIPALDAYLINHFRFRQDIKRMPFTELGCAAGAMAMSRAREYLSCYRDQRVLVLAVELPSLTYQHGDWRMANLVSTALFGDGGAGVLLSGEDAGLPGPCRLLDNQTHFFYDTPRQMGFDLTSRGFKIILDKGIPQLMRKGFRTVVDRFLARAQLQAADVEHLICHPGGRKIMDTMVEIMAVDEAKIAPSRKVLREVGNLSSASVLWVLAEILDNQPRAGAGLMCAFGPGFNAELLRVEIGR